DPMSGGSSTLARWSIGLNVVLFTFIWIILVYGYMAFLRPLHTILFVAKQLFTKYKKGELEQELEQSDALAQLEEDIENTLNTIKDTVFFATPHLQETAEAYLERIEKMYETNQKLQDTKQELQKSVRDLELNKQQLELEKAKSEAIIQSLGDGLIASSKDGNIFLINQEAQDLVGSTLEEAQGKFIEHIVDVCGEDKELACSEMPTHRALRESKRVEEEYTIETPDHRTVEIEDVATPIIQDGRTIGVVDILRDITKEKEVERAQKEFVSIASHQLRTPVTSINWNAEMLQSLENLPSEAEEAVDEIYTQNKRMNRLVRALLNLSRIDLGKLQFSVEKIQFEKLINAIKTDLEKEIEEKDITLEITGDTEFTCQNDRTLLRVVLENLLSNAIKYTPEGGSVEVYGEGCEEGTIHFYVKDNGIGIPEDQHAQVFTRLFRASNAKSKETDGTGLGLYIVKKVIDAMEGNIWFESTEGEGTVFYIDLPCDLQEISNVDTEDD
ncbi:MAG: ATP-binding protein, partial [Candidatus Paceibacteria bacterium]